MADHKKMTAHQLAEHFEVSERTVMRDMDALLVAGFPIESCQGRHGGYMLDENFVLDKTILDKDEHDILASLVQTLKIVPFKTSGLETMFPSDAWFEYDFSSWTVNDTQLFETIRHHIQHRSSFRFWYYNSQGVLSEKTVIPEKLLYKDRFWYMKAQDGSISEHRLYKLRRMSLQQTRPPFEDGVYPRITAVVLKTQLFKILDECMIHEVSDETAESYRVVFSCPPSEWVYDFILSFGARMRVLEPQAIIDTIAERIEAMSKVYEEV